MAPVAKLKERFFEPAAPQESAEIIAFPEVISENEKKRRWQFNEQSRMLREALASAPVTMESMAQQNQSRIVFSEFHAKQIDAAEHIDSIFSSAFAHIPR